MNRVVEFRTYRLQSGTRAAFQALMQSASVPLLRRWGMDVVAHGPCQEDAEGYVLIRAYEDVAHLRASQEAFYGSPEWREGPREAIVDTIESYLSVVLELDEPSIDALRKAGSSVMEPTTP